MKTTIVCGTLLYVVKKVVSAIQKNSTLPILSTIKLEADGSSIKATATNLETTLIAKEQCDCEAFAVCLNGHKLYQILNSFEPDDLMALKLGEDKATIQCGRSRFSINTLNADDFPILDNLASTEQVEFDQVELSDLLKFTQPSIATKDVRYYLNGLFFSFNQDQLDVVGTDGHRLSLKSAKTSSVFDQKSFIVPDRSVQILQKLLSEGACSLSMRKGQDTESVNSVVFTIDDSLTFVSTLIDGKYPDYNRVIPKNQSHAIVFNRQDMLDALLRVNLISGKNSVGALFEINDSQINLTTSNDGEESQEIVDIECLTEVDNGLQFRLDQNYVVDALNSFASERIRMEFEDQNVSFVFKAMADDDFKIEDGLAVVMPMRI